MQSPAGGGNTSDAGPTQAAPGAPTQVAATPQTAGALLTWNPPANNGGAAISAYQVYQSLSGGAYVASAATYSGTSASVAGLQSGGVYTFEVSATNSRGTGPLSAASAAVTIPISLPQIEISIDPANPIVMNEAMSGFNTPQVQNAAEYSDENLQAFAKLLQPGVTRFPAGTGAAAYNWQTGQVIASWATTAEGYSAVESPATAASLKEATWKGGVFLQDPAGGGNDFATFNALLGSSAILCLNGFTDTQPNSFALEATKAISLGVPVAAWEMTNEPYYYVGNNGYFTGVPDYVAKMGAIASQIHGAAGSAATVTAFYKTPYMAGGYADWDADLAQTSVANRFWNAASIHIYPLPAQYLTDDAGAMNYLNGFVTYASNSYIDETLEPLIAVDGVNLPVYISEFGAAAGNAEISPYQYTGVFYAEYLMRLSTDLNVKKVAVHSLYLGNSATTGIIRAQNDQEGVAEAYYTQHGTGLDTASLDFGYYLSAPGQDLVLVNSVINSSTCALPTTMTGGVTVATDNFNQTLATAPAVFAQAYQTSAGAHFVLITNKSGTAQSAALSSSGALTIPASVSYSTVSSAAPNAVNSPSTGVNAVVATQPATVSSAAIPVGPYSVTRVTL